MAVIQTAKESAVPGPARPSAYKRYMYAEGLPIITGYSVADLVHVELKPWERKGGLGTFIDLEGSEETSGCYVVEIPPGASLKPQKHLYEEIIYILSSIGATTVWRESASKQTFEWQQGSLFAVPLNTWHQHFNGHGDKPAKYIAATTAPLVMNLFHNDKFVFKNDFIFNERYNAEEDYFSGKGKSYMGNVWESNFIPDARTFKLENLARRGAGGNGILFELADNSLVAHISEFHVGTYKKAHRHRPGAHVILLNGSGYSLMWREGHPRIRIDWHTNSMFVPPGLWFHQHFNTGTEPARYLALRFSMVKNPGIRRNFETSKDMKLGGDQIEYKDEDPAIRKLFKEELAKTGAPWRMSQFFPDE